MVLVECSFFFLLAFSYLCKNDEMHVLDVYLGKKAVQRKGAARYTLHPETGKQHSPASRLERPGSSLQRRLGLSRREKLLAGAHCPVGGTSQIWLALEHSSNCMFFFP